jgi:tetratricopeptide (TPR) repeat protein
MKAKLIFGFLLLNQCLSAFSPGALMEDGNKAYLKGDYKKAVINYEQIISQHKVSAPEVYFNLGNAYYKLTDFPNAILNYERVLKISPLDEDAQFNRALANQHIEDRIEPVPELFYKRWFVAFRNVGSADMWAMWFILFLFLGTGCWFLFVLGNSVFKRQTGFYAGISSFLIAAFLFFVGYSRYGQDQLKDDGIVFSGSVSVKSSPSESGTGLFVLHAGTRVIITDQLGDWVKIKLPDGKEGWMVKTELEVI